MKSRNSAARALLNHRAEYTVTSTRNDWTLAANDALIERPCIALPPTTCEPDVHPAETIATSKLRIEEARATLNDSLAAQALARELLEKSRRLSARMVIKN